MLAFYFVTIFISDYVLSSFIFLFPYSAGIIATETENVT
jgi:hypothetical protein